MKVTYQNSLDDLLNLQRYFLTSTRYGNTIVTKFFVSMVVLIGAICIFSSFIIGWKIPLIIFAVATIYIWFSRFNIILNKHKKTYTNKFYQNMFSKVTVSIDDEGIKTEREFGGSQYKWNIIDHITQKDNYIYIILTGQGNFAIPLKAFKNEDESNEFYQKVLDKVGKNTPGI